VIMFWVAVLAVSILLYVLLDGFDLGVGMLFGVTREQGARRSMMSAVAPVWDGNETWLVVAGVVLWGAFPLVYSILLSAFYPAVASDARRANSARSRLRIPLADGADALDLGRELRRRLARRDLHTRTDGRRAGAGPPGLRRALHRRIYGWLSPFAALCGIGLCVGYTLLRACWLVRKCEGEVREEAYRLIPYLSVGLLAFLIIVFTYALAENLPVMSRWLERPYLLVFPVVGALAAIALMASVRLRDDAAPFLMVALIFAAAFGTLAISFWPDMIPFAITIEEAAAPHSSLAFMFWGAGLFVFPLMLLYTAISLGAFRGKVGSTTQHY
jgi:cytochrome bd ubiquinol oxidase subunit II